MRPQITSVGERAIAVLTAEGFLARVRSDVSLEQPRPGERLAAQVTLARQRVRPDVHLQRAQTHVDLGAELAGERLFRLSLGSGAVELLMLRQSRVRGVGLAAIGALVPRRVAAAAVARCALLALLQLQIDNCGSRGRRAGRRPSAVTSRRRQVLGRYGWRRSQRARAQRARG